ncbi:hypothetical protein C0995_006916 [Termitomyces sp. Mi166|nr:hypothetical protein C0995_006916 [Termitomyces sp. Mi166\
MSFVMLGARAGRIPRAVLQTRRNMSSIDNYTIPNRITLYEVPRLITPSDIRRAIAGKVEDVMNVQLDYKGFRPSGKVVITIGNTEHLAKSLRAIKSLTVCGMETRAVAQYGPDPTGVKRLANKSVDGNGLNGNYPNLERNVVLWGLPGKATIDNVATALSNFKTEKKYGKPVIVKLEKPEGKFTIFSRFVVTMASISEARRLARAWHMTPWNPNSTDLIRAQVLR